VRISNSDDAPSFHFVSIVKILGHHCISYEPTLSILLLQ